jgi:hypothetical protein
MTDECQTKLNDILKLSEGFWMEQSLFHEPGTGWAWVGHLVTGNPDAESDESQLASLAKGEIADRRVKIKELVARYPDSEVEITAAWQEWCDELVNKICQPRRKGR